MEDNLKENFGEVEPKISSEERLQRWRSLAGSVTNRRRRFQFTNQEQQHVTARPPEEPHQLVEINARKIRVPVESNINNLVDFPTFGPLMALREDPFWKDLKEQALNRLSPGDLEALDEFMDAVESIHNEASVSYDALSTNDDFLHMMVKDGCLFLLLVLYSLLGISLGYPAVFGSTHDDKQLRKWIAAMFIVGNQIPLVVVSKLMSTPFFQGAIRSTTPLKQPVGMLEKVIYEFLLFPALSTSSNQQRPTSPVDLLHALHLMMVLGPRLVESVEGQEVPISLLGPWPTPLFRTVKELRQAGIRFKGVDAMGIREIHFKHNLVKGVLYLPIYIIDDEIELLFQSLKDYEMVDQHSFRVHEVGSFLRVLSELVLTIEDVKILKAAGVIKGETMKLLGILRRLDCGGVDLSSTLYGVNLEIEHYIRPRYSKLKKFIKYCCAAGAGAAAMLSMVYTVLQYYKKND